jgi:hypothetical protein
MSSSALEEITLKFEHPRKLSIDILALIERGCEVHPIHS